ncbi:MAG TPA: ornithine carbamoyltransferase [Bryobacteraceae bacterium]|jgi:ornithine carbamoyltransferase|nr:ornithine carbamoyltransferase [Bryobacteraceae bacterium]
MTAMLPRVQRLARPDFTCDVDATVDEVHSLLELAADLKRSPASYRSALAGKSIALLFEKPSLRTRMTFELAIQQLGGFALFDVGPIGVREPLKDIARNLDRWVSGIVARTFHQQTIDDLALWSSVPVINALSDMWHPCQALADMQTIQEHFGELRGLKLAFVGDGNNVASSLMLNATRLGMDFSIATPAGYELPASVTAMAEGRVEATNDPAAAVRGAHIVYTDVWTSMGDEHEAAARKNAFRGYQVNDDLLAQAAPEAIFMHCLPAHRGEEVTDSVIESSRSVVFDEAENRLHAQKALLLMLLA